MGRMNHFKNSEMGAKAKTAEGQEAGGGWVIENSIKSLSFLSVTPTRGCPAFQNNHCY